LRPDGRIEFACGITKERCSSDSCIVASCCVAQQRIIAISRVAKASTIVKERTDPSGSIAIARSVVKKCESSIGCVFDTGVIAQKRTGANRCILLCVVGKESPRAYSSVEPAFCVAQERKQANRRVVCAGGKA
jgi:hypothetical protein